MLGKTDATATIAVKDLAAAKRFYEETLGLELVDSQEDAALVYRSGGSTVLVYASQYAGTNQATAVTWMLNGEIEGVVQRLKAKGVVFERYELPGTTREGDVHVAGTLKAAWFKDPDGNILALVSE